MKRKGMVAFALVSVMSVSALVPSVLAATDSVSGTESTVQESTMRQHRGKHGSGEAVAEPENAIGKDAAKEKALTDANVTAEQAGKVKARVTQLDDGTIVYKVKFTYDGQTYSYQIDAASGKVIDKSSEAASEEAESSTHSHSKSGRKLSVAEPENAIGKDAAKEKALADAGVTAEQAGKVKARVTQLDDGTVIYKVKFTYDGQKYSYQINATTGAIVSKSTEAATDSVSETRSKGRRGQNAGATVETATATI